MGDLKIYWTQLAKDYGIIDYKLKGTILPFKLYENDRSTERLLRWNNIYRRDTIIEVPIILSIYIYVYGPKDIENYIYYMICN